jgi:hypothetical protein
MAQVVLALQLPFVLVPLIKATSSKRLMGPHRNSPLLAGAAWACLGLVFISNVGLFVSELWPGAALVPSVEAQSPDSSLHQYVDNLAGLAWRQPGTFALVLGLLLVASTLLALQLWILVTPLSIRPASVLAKHGDSADAAGAGLDNQQQQQHARKAAHTTPRHHQQQQHGIALRTVAAGGADGAAVDRPVAVGWAVPGVREWLMGAGGSSQGLPHPPAGGGGQDVAVSWVCSVWVVARVGLCAACCWSERSWSLANWQYCQDYCLASCPDPGVLGR